MLAKTVFMLKHLEALVPGDLDSTIDDTHPKKIVKKIMLSSKESRRGRPCL